MKQHLIIVILVVFGVFFTFSASAAFGESPAADVAPDQGPVWLAALVEQAERETSSICRKPPAPADWKKPIPLGFYVDYTVVSDYIWYGINLSEYRGEGREKPNHHLTVGTNYDTGDFGMIDFSVLLRWNGAYDNVTGVDSDGSLHEVDYSIAWTYDLAKLNPDVPVSVTLAWTGYDFPQISDDAGFTNVLCATLALDDKKLFGEDWFALNPSITYGQDLDDTGSLGQGAGLFFCMSHTFELAKCPGLGQTPIIKDLTVTPSFMFSMDVGFVDSGTRPLAAEYGLAVGYDLSKALGVPKKYGKVTLTGFLNYSDAIADDSSRINLNDEFWGGFTVGWKW